MSVKGLKRRIALMIINKLLVGTNVRSFEIKRKILNWSGMNIGKGTKIVGPINIKGKLIVGRDVWIGTNITIHGNGCVTIKDNCDIAPDVTFLTGGHDIGGKERRAGTGFNKDTVVGQGTWICAKSIIIGGNDIGDGCVVAAGSVVNKSVKSNSLVGGTPIKTIKNLN